MRIVHIDVMLGLSRTWCIRAGNTTVIGSLLFGTAYLGQGEPSALAQNLTEVLQVSNLAGATQKEALAEAIKQALAPPSDIMEAFAQEVLPQAMQQLMPNATAALVAAAIAANQAAAVAEGFAMVSLLLGIACVAYGDHNNAACPLWCPFYLKILGADGG